MTCKVSINNNQAVCGSILSSRQLQNGMIQVEIERVELTTNGTPKENQLGVILATMTQEEFMKFKQEREQA